MPQPSFQLPVSRELFLRDYWQRQPLLMRQAARHLDVLDGNTLAGLALEEEVEARLITGADSGPWHNRNGPFTEADFDQLPDTDWTLLVQSADHYLTEVSLLLDSFDFLPSWRLEDIMVSYAAPGGSVGPHFDLYDVFLVQASGQRRWKIGNCCDANTPLQQHDSLKLLADMPVTEELLLEPGDVLYLPPHLAHWGIAESDDCITWSVGLRAPELYQLSDWLLAESEATRQPRLYQDGGSLKPSAAGPALQAADAQAMLDQAIQQLSRLPTQSLLSQWLSLPRQNTLELLDVDRDAIKSLAADAVLVRHGGARLLLEDDSASVAWINGQGYDISNDARPLATLLASQRLYTQAQLAPVTQTDAARQLLQRWTDGGYFYTL